MIGHASRQKTARAPGRKTGRKNVSPEHALQVGVRQFLVQSLCPSIEWTANAAGVRVTIKTALKMKASGVRRGWPDLQFLFPDGVTRYIELKAGASLSPEQRAFRDRVAGYDIWALCRSIDEVEAVLRRWGAPLRSRPFSSIQIASVGTG